MPDITVVHITADENGMPEQVTINGMVVPSVLWVRADIEPCNPVKIHLEMYASEVILEALGGCVVVHPKKRDVEPLFTKQPQDPTPKQIREVPCTVCQAPAGEFCRRLGGRGTRYTEASHPSRINAYLRREEQQRDPDLYVDSPD